MMKKLKNVKDATYSMYEQALIEERKALTVLKSVYKYMLLGVEARLEQIDKILEKNEGKAQKNQRKNHQKVEV